MFGSKTIKFTIFSSNRKNIYQNNSKLDLICHSVDELESWKASLLRAGVYPEVSIFKVFVKNYYRNSIKRKKRQMSTKLIVVRYPAETLRIRF